MSNKISLHSREGYIWIFSSKEELVDILGFNFLYSVGQKGFDFSTIVPFWPFGENDKKREFYTFDYIILDSDGSFLDINDFERPINKKGYYYRRLKMYENYSGGPVPFTGYKRFKRYRKKSYKQNRSINLTVPVEELDDEQLLKVPFRGKRKTRNHYEFERRFDCKNNNWKRYRKNQYK